MGKEIISLSRPKQDQSTAGLTPDQYSSCLMQVEGREGGTFDF